MKMKAEFAQIIKFGVVGIVQNGIGYLTYLLFVSVGLDPKIAISIVYPIGAFVSFWGNRQWTFSHSGPTGRAMLRFIVSHIGGYSINVVMLYFFVDVFGVPHQLVQAVAIFVVAGYLFLMMRFFVFHK